MAKTIVMVLGVVFVLIGVLGFFMAPDGLLLGLFAVDTIHNLVHIVSGLAGLAMASMGEASARTYGKVFGVVYLLVTVLGFIMGDGQLLGLMAINNADNWLHVVLTAILLYVGFSRPAAPTVTMGGQTM